MKGTAKKRMAAAVLGLAVAAWALPGLAMDGVFEITGAGTLTNPGSYRLTRDISIFGGSCLVIAADDVRLDLNGHQVYGGVVIGAHSGAIVQASGVANLTVLNGTVSGGWGPGIAATGTGARVMSVRVHNCTGSAIVLGDDAAVTDCTAFSNTLGSVTGAVIRAGDNSRVENCMVLDNSGGSYSGIDVGDRGAVERCMVGGNGVSGSLLTGVRAGDDARVRLCSVVSNAGPVAADCYGIVCGTGAIIERCLVVDEQGGGGGIQAGPQSQISECVAENLGGTAFELNDAAMRRCVAVSNGAGAVYGYSCWARSNTVVESFVAWGNLRGIYHPTDDQDAQIRRCVVKHIVYDGVEPGSWSDMRECLVDNIGDNGIDAWGHAARIRDCHVLDAGDVGLFMGGTNGAVVGNSVVCTGTCYYFNLPNTYGEVTNAPHNGFTKENPWLNFEF